MRSRVIRGPRSLTPFLRVLIALAIPAGLALATVSSRRGNARADFGADAGYVWRGRVASVEGSWRVPRLLNSSRGGLAATWIGATGSSVRRPFIQIGTEELRGFSANHTPENRYWAFWSDTTHHFHPVFLTRVTPGDAVTASLVLEHKRWELALTDEATRTALRFSTGEEAGASFDQAQWTQEDATGATNSLFPYPTLSAVTMRHLAVNFGPPTYDSLYATWMSVGSHNFAPTPLKHDEFTLRKATIGPTGERYLQASARWLAAARAFAAELARALTRPSYAEISSASQRFSISLRSEIRALADARWPTSLHGMISLLRGRLSVLVRQAKTPATATPAALTLWGSALSRDTSAVLYEEHLIRRTLGVPEVP